MPLNRNANKVPTPEAVSLLEEYFSDAMMRSNYIAFTPEVENALSTQPLRIWCERESYCDKT